MNADLERTLSEMGPEYRALVRRMTDAFAEAAPAAAPRTRPAWPWRLPARAAAAVAAVLCAAAGLLLARAYTRAPATAAPARPEYVLAYSSDAATVAAIVRTQQADGSWANDFITCQNAAALRDAAGDAPRVAYRRALRYLRAKGLAPLSDAELRARAQRAARQDGPSRT